MIIKFFAEPALRHPKESTNTTSEWEALITSLSDGVKQEFEGL